MGCQGAELGDSSGFGQAACIMSIGGVAGLSWVAGLGWRTMGAVRVHGACQEVLRQEHMAIYGIAPASQDATCSP